MTYGNRSHRRPAASIAWAITLLLASSGCEPDKPPAPKPASDAPQDAARTATFDPDADQAVLTFAGERGSFRDSAKVEDVPEPARGLVRVNLLQGPAAPPGTVWVTNLRKPDDEGAFALSTVPRELFEELALGQGLSSEVELPPGLEPPTDIATAAGEVIVYKTAWCGVCKKVQSYLDRKGVPYVAKDIEKDHAAAAELQAKAKQAGAPMGSVPVIDVGGELIVGFDRARLEKLLEG